MAKIAVITGDLVNSTGVSTPAKFRRVLKKILGGMEVGHGVVVNTHRGDGFQVAVPSDENPFQLAVLIRAALISSSPDKKNRWDARLAIAFGKANDSVGDQNSDVFVNSGRALDAMKDERLAVYSEDEKESLAYDVAASFADNLISQWTVVEAEVIYYYLKEHANHERIAALLNKKRPTITQALNRANYGLVNKFIKNMNQMANLP